MTELDLEIPANTNNVDDWRGVKENTAAKVEQSFLESALKQHQGDIKKVAENMGITSRAVYNKLKKYDIKLAEYRRL
jgi:two-component system response regulator HydG